MNINQMAYELARERQERLIEELARERLVDDPAHPSASRSAAASSRWANGSRRSHHSSWLGPAEGPGRLPTWRPLP